MVSVLGLPTHHPRACEGPLTTRPLKWGAGFKEGFREHAFVPLGSVWGGRVSMSPCFIRRWRRTRRRVRVAQLLGQLRAGALHTPSTQNRAGSVQCTLHSPPGAHSRRFVAAAHCAPGPGHFTLCTAPRGTLRTTRCTRHHLPSARRTRHTGTPPPPSGGIGISTFGEGGRKRHQQEHRPQRPTERSDPTQHAKGRTGDCPGPRKETTTRRDVTQGGGGFGKRAPLTGPLIAY